MIYDIQSITQRYGRAPKDEKQATQYLKALKYIIAADGVAEEEWEALLKGMERMQASQAIVDEVTQFDPSQAKLEDLLPNFSKGGTKARLLLRDAIDLSRADGTYAKEEKAAVRQAAQALGVDKHIVSSLEALVEMEHAVKRLRKALL